MSLADILEFGNADDLDDEIDAFFDDEEEEAMGGPGMASLASLVDHARGAAGRKPAPAPRDVKNMPVAAAGARLPAASSYVDAAATSRGTGCDLSTLDGLLRERGYSIEGLQDLWEPSEDAGRVRDQFVVAVTDLLRSSAVDTLWKEKQLETLARLQSDAQQQERTVAKLSGQLEACDREIGDLLERERRAKVQLKRTQVQAKKRTEALQVSLVNLQRKEIQYKHDARRYEQQAADMKQKVQKIMGNRNHQIKAAVELESDWLARFDKDQRRRAKHGSPAGQNRGQEGSNECELLWDSLKAVSSELDALLVDSKPDDKAAEALKIAPAVFQMPYDVAKESVDESLRERLALLRARLLEL